MYEKLKMEMFLKCLQSCLTVEIIAALRQNHFDRKNFKLATILYIINYQKHWIHKTKVYKITSHFLAYKANVKTQMTILVKKSHFSFFASKEEKFTSLKVVIIIHCFGLIDTLVILELTFRRSSFKRRPDIHSRLTFLRNLIFDIWLKNMHKTYIGFHISCSFTHTQTKAATASLTREKG